MSVEVVLRIWGKWQERRPEGDARVMQGVGYLHLLFNSFNDLLHQYICDQFLQNIVTLGAGHNNLTKNTVKIW